MPLTSMSEPPPTRAAVGDRARRVVIHGLVLLAVLWMTRGERVAYARLVPSAVEWAQLLWSDLALVLLFEAFWLGLAGLSRLVPGRLFGLLLLVGHVSVLAVALVAHQFYLHTGTQLDLDVLFYAIANYDQVGGLVGTGVDSDLALKVGLVLLLLALGESRARKPFGFVNLQRPGLVAGLAASAGVVLLALPPLPARTGVALLSQCLVAQLLNEGKGRVGTSGADVSTLAASTYVPPKTTGAPKRRPNVVLVLLESTRRDAVSAYSGAEPATTPFLDSLAASGLIFDDAYTTISHTSKTLVGILCGMYATWNMPIVESRIPRLPLKCLPQLLGAQGYRTAFFQTALGRFENRPGLLRNLGYDTWKVQEDLEGPFRKVGYFGMDDFAMLQPALDWVDAGQGPFFLTVLTVGTHHPYQLPSQDAQPPETKVSYLKAVAHSDRFLEALYRGLEAGGHVEDTVFVIMGDHGEAFGEHGRRQHDLVPYHEVTHVPLIVVGPDWLGPPRRVGGLRTQLDLLPTVLADVLRIPWSGRLDGRSLLSSSGHDSVVTSCWYPDRCMSLRWGDLHFVYHYDHRPMEAFDLRSDPEEKLDVADHLPDPLLKAALRKLLDARASVAVYYQRTLGT